MAWLVRPDAEFRVRGFAAGLAPCAALWAGLSFGLGRALPVLVGAGAGLALGAAMLRFRLVEAGGRDVLSRLRRAPEHETAGERVPPPPPWARAGPLAVRVLAMGMIAGGLVWMMGVNWGEDPDDAFVQVVGGMVVTGTGVVVLRRTD